MTDIIKSIEKYRKQIVRNIFLSQLILIVIITFLISYINTIHALITFILLFFIIETIVFVLYPIKFKQKYKFDIIKPLIEDKIPSVTYHPNSFIDKKEFINSEIFNDFTSFTYRGEDYIEGELSDVKIKASELFVRRNNYVIFNGFFMVVDFNKNLKGMTFVTPASKFNKVFCNSIVKLENQEFNEKYSVFGTDFFEARYVLTLSMMERILEYGSKYNQELSFSFKENKMYVASMVKDQKGLTRNLFEPKLFKTIDTLDFDEYIDTINLIRDLIEDLHLNYKLWA